MGTAAARRRIRQEVHYIEEDRFLAPYLKAAEDLVRSGALLKAVEHTVELQ